MTMSMCISTVICMYGTNLNVQGMLRNLKYMYAIESEAFLNSYQIAACAKMPETNSEMNWFWRKKVAFVQSQRIITIKIAVTTAVYNAVVMVGKDMITEQLNAYHMIVLQLKCKMGVQCTMGVQNSATRVRADSLSLLKHWWAPKMTCVK
eukprot:scpid86627/ scgid21736/ 